MARATPAAATTILSARGPERAGLREPCLLGDDLGVEGEDGGMVWFVQTGLLATSGGRVVCAYRDGARALRFCVDLGARGGVTPAAIARARAHVAPAAAERRWRAFLDRLHAAAPLTPGRALATHVTALPESFGVSAARRLVHPSPLIDRLMVRDRRLALDRLEAATPPAARAAPGE